MPWQQSRDGLESIPITLALLVIYIGVFIAERNGVNTAVLQAFPWRLGAGESWRLLTSTLVHGDLLHLIFNAIWFFQLNQAIERWLGPVPTLLMYAFFAIGAGAAQAVFSGGTAIGASGVVYGVFGFLWVCRRRYDIAAEVVTPQTIQMMLGWLVICAVVNQFGGNIANTAHVAGLGFGWLLGQIVIAHQRSRPLLILGTFALWAAMASLTWLPVWEHTLAFVPVVRNQYQGADVSRESWPGIESPARRGARGR